MNNLKVYSIPGVNVHFPGIEPMQYRDCIKVSQLCPSEQHVSNNVERIHCTEATVVSLRNSGHEKMGVLDSNVINIDKVK